MLAGRQRAIRRNGFGVAVLLLSCAAQAATPLPDSVASMIAASANDPDTFKAVVATAKKTNPDSIAAIDAQVAAIRESQSEARVKQLATQGVLEGWTGTARVGLTNDTGNTVATAVVLGLKLSKQGPRWKHSFAFDANIKTEDGLLTKQRILVGYEGNYDLTQRLYVVGVGAWTQDIFAGFDNRFLESVGLGYRVWTTPTVRLRLEAGPGLRQTYYTTDGSTKGVVARFAGDFQWKLKPWLTFGEVTSYVYQGDSSTFSSLTSLTTRFADAFSTRLSFDIQNDDNPPTGRVALDTTTIISVVYDF
jgi:putative salt-induced outer membrane protein